MSDWRQFEKLVATMEGVLLQRGAVIKHPDRIPDIDTGELREVDASIRYTIGSVPLLITIECRKRAKNEDVMWIEQLAEKQRSVGAAKTIAVSSTGFTEPARKKAAQKGIELRTLRKIKPKDIEAWVSDLFLLMHQLLLKVIEASVTLDLLEGDKEANIAITHPGWHEERSFVSPFFKRNNGTSASINDMLSNQIEAAFSKKIKEKGNSEPTEQHFEAAYSPGELMLETSLGDRTVTRINVTALLSVHTKNLTPTDAHVYANTEADILQKYDFHTDVAGKNMNVELIFSKKQTTA